MKKRSIPSEKPNFSRDLTKRELEICGLIAKGLSSEFIAKTLYISEGTIKNHVTSIYEKTGFRNRAQLTAAYVVEYEQVITDVLPASRDTELCAQADAYLRLIGLPGLPELIPLVLKEGQPYVIGRFDVNIGRKQCDFEFEKTTKTVSRRQAAVERVAYGYSITDLNSRAGTFVNGNSIIPGKPFPLRHGDQVSFGNAGVEYVFEGNKKTMA
ncbi:MAG: FHA domain-containing protein [Oscillospiraceae bacterium]|nr:FHA domain-containing protein [Oscillospiraceae bacterium]